MGRKQRNSFKGKPTRDTEYSNIIIPVDNMERTLLDAFRNKMEAKNPCTTLILSLSDQEIIEDGSKIAKGATLFFVSHSGPGSHINAPDYFHAARDFAQKHQIRTVEIVGCHSASSVVGTDNKESLDRRVTSQVIDGKKSRAQALSEFLGNNIDVYGYVGGHIDSTNKNKESKVKVDLGGGEVLKNANEFKACFQNGKLTEEPQFFRKRKKGEKYFYMDNELPVDNGYRVIKDRVTLQVSDKNEEIKYIPSVKDLEAEVLQAESAVLEKKEEASQKPEGVNTNSVTASNINIDNTKIDSRQAIIDLSNMIDDIGTGPKEQDEANRAIQTFRRNQERVSERQQSDLSRNP